MSTWSIATPPRHAGKPFKALALYLVRAADNFDLDQGVRTRGAYIVFREARPFVRSSRTDDALRHRGSRRGFYPMDSSSQIIADAGLGPRTRPRKSRWPARLDVMQSASGLALALFMWGHMFFVSSILISKDAMWTITKMFEGYFFFGRAYPWIVSIVVGCVLALFVGHALPLGRAHG